MKESKWETSHTLRRQIMKKKKIKSREQVFKKILFDEYAAKQ